MLPHKQVKFQCCLEPKEVVLSLLVRESATFAEAWVLVIEVEHVQLYHCQKGRAWHSLDLQSLTLVVVILSSPPTPLLFLALLFLILNQGYVYRHERERETSVRCLMSAP